MGPAANIDHPSTGHVDDTDEDIPMEFKNLELAAPRTTDAAGEDKDDSPVERQLTEDDIIQALSRRKTAVDGASPADKAQVEAL